MATGNDLRRIALALPHAEEKPHFERASFRVAAPRGKIFATLPADGRTANLMLSRDQQSLLCDAEPDLFSPVPNKWGETGATVFQIAQADLVTLQSALRLAWTTAAPPNLHVLLD